MNRFALVLLVALGFLPSASAVEIKNVRPCFGPFGATRFPPIQCVPGDVLFMTYEIDGLALKDGKASYVTILELLDPKDKGKDGKEKVLFEKRTDNDVVPQLGGNRMPGDLHLITGAKLPPGKYALRLSVHDRFGNDAKAFRYEFDLVPETFGMIGVMAPAVGFLGQPYAMNFAVVNMTLDAKKQPNAEITIRVFDEKDKTKPISDVKMLLPRDMPDGTDLEKANFVPLSYPIFLNRVGRYNVEVLAHDKNGNRRAEVRYSLTVIDVGAIAR